MPVHFEVSLWDRPSGFSAAPSRLFTWKKTVQKPLIIWERIWWRVVGGGEGGVCIEKWLLFICNIYTHKHLKYKWFLKKNLSSQPIRWLLVWQHFSVCADKRGAEKQGKGWEGTGVITEKMGNQLMAQIQLNSLFLPAGSLRLWRCFLQLCRADVFLDLPGLSLLPS